MMDVPDFDVSNEDFLVVRRSQNIFSIHSFESSAEDCMVLGEESSVGVAKKDLAVSRLALMASFSPSLASGIT